MKATTEQSAKYEHVFTHMHNFSEENNWNREGRIKVKQTTFNDKEEELQL